MSNAPFSGNSWHNLPFPQADTSAAEGGTRPGQSTPQSNAAASFSGSTPSTTSAASPSDTVSQQYRLRCPRMPLAVYREVAAHLRQVDGVDVGLLPQPSQEFNYTKSQIGGLWISYQPEVGNASHQRVEEILAYYGDRFGVWEAIYQDE